MSLQEIKRCRCVRMFQIGLRYTDKILLRLLVGNRWAATCIPSSKLRDFMCDSSVVSHGAVSGQKSWSFQDEEGLGNMEH